MGLSRSKKASLSMVTAGFYEILTLAVGLIVPRLILQAFGSSSNGLISSISQFLSYITVLQLGVAGPTRVALYGALSKNDIEKTSAIVNATEKYYRKIGYIFFGYMLFLACVFPFLVKTEYTGLQVASLVLIIGIGTFAEYCFGITYTTFLTAAQESYTYTIIKIVTKILNTIVAVILIRVGSSIFIVKLGSAIIFSLNPILLNIYVHKKYSLIKTIEPDYSGLSQRKAAASSTIANIIHEKVDIFLLTFFATTSLISVYSVYMIVMNGLISVMRVFTGALEAPFGDMWARGEKDNISKNISLYEFLVYSFTSVVFSCAGLLLIPFISLYTNVVTDVNYIRPGFAVLLTITTASYCLRQPYITMVQAAGKYEETKWGCYLEALINVVVSLILIHKYELIGITIGTLAANLIRTLQYASFMSKNMINRSFLVVMKRIIWLMLDVATITIICKMVPFLIRYDSWFNWFLSGIYCFLISVIITIIWAAVFYKNDLKNFIDIVKRIVKK